jgi:hypothetical protein
MDLSDDLKRQLEDAVFNNLGAMPTAQGLRLLVGPKPVRELPPGLSPYGHAQWVVRVSLSQATPEIFIEVVKLTDLAGELRELQAIVAQLAAHPDTWAAPVVAGLWVPKRWPFIDRTSVVAALAAMADGDGPAAVAIEGSYGHGKKTMVEYIRSLAVEKGSFELAVVELRKEPEPGILESIVTELSVLLNEPPDMDTTHVEPERQATILARDVAQIALDTAQPIWVVAHFVESTGLEEGVLAFIDELLGLVQGTAAIGAKLRILLLCDQLAVLELKNAPPLDARHALSQVSDGEIRAWLEAAAPGKPQQVYELFTDSVTRQLARANPALSRRLKWVSSRCAITQRRLLAVEDE